MIEEPAAVFEDAQHECLPSLSLGLLERPGTQVWGVFGHVVNEPVVGDPGYSVVPDGGASGRGWPLPEPRREPFRWVGTQEVGGAVDGDVDGSPVSVGVAGLDAVSGECVRPAVFGRLDVGPEPVERCFRFAALFDGIRVVDDDESCPWVRPGGVPFGGTFEVDCALAVLVIDRQDVADVVAVDGSDTAADVEVGAGINGRGEVGAQCGRVGYVRGVLDVAGAAGSPHEFGCGKCAGEPGDLVDVGVLDRDEGLGAGGVEPGEEVGLGVVGGLGGQRDAVLVAFVEFGGLGDGGVEPGAVPGTGEGDVGGFAVQPGGADDEYVVAGDAEGLVDSEGVAVVDPPRLR